MWAAGNPPPCVEPPVDSTHPEHQIIWVTASQGSILEFYRRICVELEMCTASSSRAVLTKLVRK
ncbi:hypothetical protein DFAR_2330005 [Desulfarculales bacterium]